MRPKIKFKPKGIKKPKKKSNRHPPSWHKRRYRARTEKKYKIKPEKVVAALIKEHGLISPAAKVLNTPRTTLLRYIEQFEVCREALAHAREGMGDVAESKLIRTDRARRRSLHPVLSLDRAPAPWLRPQ